jgi:hypothetical protein
MIYSKWSKNEKMVKIKCRCQSSKPKKQKNVFKGHHQIDSHCPPDFTGSSIHLFISWKAIFFRIRDAYLPFFVNCYTLWDMKQSSTINTRVILEGPDLHMCLSKHIGACYRYYHTSTTPKRYIGYKWNFGIFRYLSSYQRKIIGWESETPNIALVLIF